MAYFANRSSHELLLELSRMLLRSKHINRQEIPDLLAAAARFDYRELLGARELAVQQQDELEAADLQHALLGAVVSALRTVRRNTARVRIPISRAWIGLEGESGP